MAAQQHRKTIARSGSSRRTEPYRLWQAEVPSLADAGLPGMVIYTWFGFLGPANMRSAIVNKLHAEVVKAISAPAVRERLQGAELIGASPDEFSRIVRADMKRWAGAVQAPVCSGSSSSRQADARPGSRRTALTLAHAAAIPEIRVHAGTGIASCR